MKIYASKAFKGFYDSSIHSELPKDAVEIGEKLHKELLEGQSQGKVINFDTKNGIPVLIDAPVPTEEQLLSQAKIEAQAYLNSTDWYLARKIELGKDVPKEVLAKRQEARDLLSK